MKRIIIVTLLVLLITCGKAQTYILYSPDEKLTSIIEINQGVRVELLKGGEELLTISGLSLEIANEKQELAGQRVKKIHRTFVNEEIKPTIREKSDSYINCYNELVVGFKSNFSLTFRLFNEGLAYRFSTSAKDSLVIVKENLNVQFQEDDSVRFQASKSFNSAYETPYEYHKLNGLEKDKLVNLPVLVEKHNGSFVMITESDLYNYPGLWLKGTRAHAMALFIILSSPMEMLPDSPSDYYREKECTDFLAEIPLEWDETILLKGQISKYTVLARRSGEDWYVGAITNQDERTFELPTEFLKQGFYQIEAIEDGINANTRATDYRKIDIEFQSGEVLKLKLAEGGGWVARITPLK